MSLVRNGIRAALILMSCWCHAEAKPLAIYFGNVKRMPESLEAPALASATYLEAVYNRLVSVDEDYKLRPALLKRFLYDRTLGGYLLEISPEVRFHNGRLADATDLEFSLLRGFFSSKQNFFRVYLGNIEGVDKIKPGTPYAPGSVKGVQVLNRSSILVRLAVPNPSFLHSLGTLVAALVPREELENDYFTWKHKPVGAGRFRVASFDEHLFRVGLTSVEDPSLSFDLLYSDSATDSEISFEPKPGFLERAFDRPSTVSTLIFSSKNRVAQNRDLRLAFARAVRRKSLLQHGYTTGDQILPPNFWGRSNKTVQVEPPKATFKVAEITSSVLNLKKNVSPQTQTHIELIKDAIATLGARAKVSLSSNKFFSEQEALNTTVFALSFIVDYFDPLITLAGLGPESPTAGVFWGQDRRLKGLFERSAKSTSYFTRIKSVRTLSEYLVKEAYVVPLGYKVSKVYFNPQRISDLGTLDYPEMLHLERVKFR